MSFSQGDVRSCRWTSPAGCSSTRRDAATNPAGGFDSRSKRLNQVVRIGRAGQAVVKTVYTAAAIPTLDHVPVGSGVGDGRSIDVANASWQ
eukprot:scaffold79071_cov121-Phaeocystis_antarctica.AAC.6